MSKHTTFSFTRQENLHDRASELEFILHLPLDNGEANCILKN